MLDLKKFFKSEILVGFFECKAKGTGAASGWILMEPFLDIIFSSVWNLQNIGFCWFYANKATVQDSEYWIWADTLHWLRFCCSYYIFFRLNWNTSSIFAKKSIQKTFVQFTKPCNLLCSKETKNIFNLTVSTSK